MRIVDLTRLREWQLANPAAAAWLEAWREVVKQARWTELSDVQKTYPDAQQHGNILTFPVPGGTIHIRVEYCSRIFRLKALQLNDEVE